MNVTPVYRFTLAVVAPASVDSDRLLLEVRKHLLVRGLNCVCLPINDGGMFVVDCRTESEAANELNMLQAMLADAGCRSPQGRGHSPVGSVQTIYRVAEAHNAPNYEPRDVIQTEVLEALRTQRLSATWLPFDGGGIFAVDCPSEVVARDAIFTIRRAVKSYGGTNLDYAPCTPR